MAKNKTKKKNKKNNNNKRGGSSEGGGSGTTKTTTTNTANQKTNIDNKKISIVDRNSINSSSRSSSSSDLIWSTTDECSYYAALGCHIANLHQLNYHGTTTNNNSNKKNNASSSTTKPSKSRQSEYEQMYQLAQRQYPWIVGIELFDPSEYHPEDIQYIPEVAMNDGDDYDDYDMTLTLTNVTNHTNICFVTVYDVDLCGADGSILQSGITTTTTTTTSSSSTTSVTEDDDDDDHNDGDITTTNATVPTLAAAATTTTMTKERKCTTFIVLCPPRTFVHLCSLSPNQQQQQQQQQIINQEEEVPIINDNIITSWSQVEIENDVQPWSSHSNVDDEHEYLLRFPFGGATTDDDDEQTTEDDDDDTTATCYYQCTQSEHGQLTHFFHGNYHAIDFACPVGTPLYSPVNGIVVDVRDKRRKQKQQQQQQQQSQDGGDNEDTDKSSGSSGKHDTEEEVSGIATKNLFHWNSIMIQVVDDETTTTSSSSTTATSLLEKESVDETTATAAATAAAAAADNNPLYIEFVHIQTNSCIVQVGDVVRKGQLVCRSGSVGFSPEPHLHLAAYRSRGDDAATVRVRFECGGGNGGGRSSRGSSDEGDVNGIQPAGDDGETPNGKKALSFLPVAGGWYNRNGIK